MSESDRNSQLEDGSMELTFVVPWGVISAKAYGDPCLQPVLMVHGLQDNAGTFDRIMPLLPKTFYYVNIELPGHGKSSRIPKGIPLDFMLYVSSIRRVVKQLNWTQYYYIGHSLGGQLGFYYTSLYQEEVKKLIVLDTISALLSSPSEFSKFHKERTKKLMEVEYKIQNEGPSYTYEEALRRMIENRISPISKPAAVALLKRSLKKHKNGCYYFAMDQRLKNGVIGGVTPEQHLIVMSKIQCPVLIVMTYNLLEYIRSESTKKYLMSTLELLQKKENVQIVYVDGYHDVHNNEPEVVAPHINSFLIKLKSVL